MVPIPASCPGPWGCKGSMQAESRCDRCELAGILLHGARLFLGARMNMYIYIYIEYAENIYIYNILRSIYSTLCTYVFNIIHIITLPRSYQQDFGAYP